MKSRSLFLAALLLLALALLAGCGGGKTAADEGPDDEPIALLPAGKVIDLYTKD